MDPGSIAGLVLTLTGFCAKAVTGLNSLKESYDDSSLSLTSLASECATLGAALSVLEGSLSRLPAPNSSDSSRALFGENGHLTEAIHGSVRCCFMAMSELQDEIAEIQKHSAAPGTLNMKGKSLYVLNEGRISQLASLLRGQSGVLTTLETILQRKSFEEMDKMMRRHYYDVRRVNAESERSWRNRNNGAHPPRSLAEASSILNADTATLMSSRVFDFDDVAVNATAYRNVMSRAMFSRGNTRNQRSRGAVLDEDEEGLPSLFGAVRSLNSETVSLLLGQGDDPNQVDGSGMTPLQRCAGLTGPLAARVASTLVMHGADIDAHRAGTGMTALRIAAKSGNLAVVKALLGMGADLSIADRLGSQAIHAAVQFGHCDVVNHLLGGSEGEHVSPVIQAAMWDDQDLARDSGCTLLHFAAASSSNAGEEMVKLLLTHGIEPETQSGRGKTALQYALSRGKSDVIAHLVQCGGDVVPAILRLAESDELNFICDAIEDLDLDAVGSQGRTAASMAAEQGKTDALRSLLKRGASALLCDQSEKSPLSWSLHVSNHAAIELCMFAQPASSYEDVSALLTLVMSSTISDSSKERLVVLLAEKSDEDISGQIYDAALRNDWLAVVTWMLKAGQVADGELPRYAKMAVKMHRYNILDTIFEAKFSKITDPRQKRRMLLMWAVEATQIEVADYLLEQHASLWDRERDLMSPLFSACTSGNGHLTRNLLEYIRSDIERTVRVKPEQALLGYLSERVILTLIIKLKFTHLLSYLPWDVMNRYVYLENGLPPFVIVASTTGDLDTAKALVRLGADLDGRIHWSEIGPSQDGDLLNGDTALAYAVRQDMADFAALLLQLGAEADCRAGFPQKKNRKGEPDVEPSYLDIMPQGWPRTWGAIVEDTPLITVLCRRQANEAKLVKILLQHGADVNYRSGLHRVNIADLARKLSFELPKSQRSPLEVTRARRFGIQNFRGPETFVSFTPLMLACVNDDLPAVELLLADKRIDLSLTERFGPLHVAVMSNNIPLLEALLADGRFDVNDTTDSESHTSMLTMGFFTPICLAALGGFLEILQLLVRKGGGDINERYANFDEVCTPLCLAVHRGHVHIVKFLLGIGARLSRNDATFSTARSNADLTAILEEELEKRELGKPEAEIGRIEVPKIRQPTPMPQKPAKKRTLGRRLSALLLRREKTDTLPSPGRLETVTEYNEEETRLPPALEEHRSLPASEEQLLTSLLPQTRRVVAMEELERERTTMLNSSRRNIS